MSSPLISTTAAVATMSSVGPVCVDTKNEGRMKEGKRRREQGNATLSHNYAYVEDRTLIYG